MQARLIIDVQKKVSSLILQNEGMRSIFDVYQLTL